MPWMEQQRKPPRIPPSVFSTPNISPEFAYPGGNSGMLRHLVKWLIPGAINGTSDAELLANPFNLSAMDDANNNVRVRQGALIVRGDTSSGNASVIYFSNGQFFQWTLVTTHVTGEASILQIS
jgi:hypothetical protein